MECQPQVEGRTAEIAAAARALIAERGFEGLRTRDIAARVGINVATLHYHVPTKQALVELVARSLRDAFIAQNRVRPREGLSATDMLEHEFTDFRETMIEKPETFIVMTELNERARRDETVRALVGPMMAYVHGDLTRILEKGRASGEFRADLDPPAAALMIFGALIATQRAPDHGAAFFDRTCAELFRAVRAPSTRD